MDLLFISSIAVSTRTNRTKPLISHLNVRRGTAPRRGLALVALIPNNESEDKRENVGDVDSESSAAWAAWQSSRSKPEDAAESSGPRDPDAETDFWRDTARSLGSTDKSAPREIRGGTNFMEGGIGLEDPFATISGNGENAFAPVDGTIENPFAPADPVKEEDFFSLRNIDESNAVVSKEEEQRNVWADAREVTSGVEAVKQQLEDELTAYDPESELDKYRDAAREIFPGDDAVEEVAFPGQAANLGGGVYGSEANLDAEEMEAWRKSAGFQARDPKAETDFWRSAAREVVSNIPSSEEEVSSSTIPVENETPLDSQLFKAEDLPMIDNEADPLISSVLPTTNPAPSYEPQITSRDTQDVQPTASFADFHAANERWSSALQSEEKADWGGGSEWGSGTDSSRWQAWDTANSPNSAASKAQQGASRDDGGVLGEQTDMWMQAAREVVSGEEPLSSSNFENGSASTGKKNDKGEIDFWASAAREITESLPDQGEKPRE